MKSNKFSLSINRTVRTTIAAAFVVASVNVYATDATSDLAVGASVANACSITTTPIDFGAYDPVLKNQIDATGAVNVTCTLGATTSVKLGQGANPGAGSTDAVPVRQMMSGANILPYHLSTGADQTVVWENTTGVSHTGTGNLTTLTVYGRIAANENVPAGTYADTVVATVTF